MVYDTTVPVGVRHREEDGEVADRECMFPGVEMNERG